MFTYQLKPPSSSIVQLSQLQEADFRKEIHVSCSASFSEMLKWCNLKFPRFLWGIECMVWSGVVGCGVEDLNLIVCGVWCSVVWCGGVWWCV